MSWLSGPAFLVPWKGLMMHLNAKQRVYFEIARRCNRDVAWMANVILTGCRKPTKRMRALLSLVDAGHEVGSLAYVMPYVAFVVDGVAVRFELLDDPNGTVEQYRYDPKYSVAPAVCGMN